MLCARSTILEIGYGAIVDLHRGCLRTLILDGQVTGTARGYGQGSNTTVHVDRSFGRGSRTVAKDLHPGRGYIGVAGIGERDGGDHTVRGCGSGGGSISHAVVERGP